MSKNQKIASIIALLLMAFILLYPPIEKYVTENYYSPEGRMFLFSIADSFGYRLNIKNLIAEILVVGILGGALMIFLGLKKK